MPTTILAGSTDSPPRSASLQPNGSPMLSLDGATSPAYGCPFEGNLAFGLR